MLSTCSMPEENNLEKLQYLISVVSSNSKSLNSNQRQIDESNPKMVVSRKPSNAVSLSTKSCGLTSVDKQRISKKKWKFKHQREVNASERERKGRLAANIKKIKEILPLPPGKLQTKEIILEEALNYIKKLKEQIEEMLLKNAPENLVLEISKLRMRVENMEKERKVFEQILQTHGLLSSNQTKPAKIPIPRIPIKQKSSVAPPTNHNTSSTFQTTSFSQTSNSITTVSNNPSTVKQSAALTSTTILSTSSLTNSTPCSTSQLPLHISPSFVDVFHTISPHAFCSPTYSMARIKHAAHNQLPCLSSDQVHVSKSKSQDQINKSDASFNTVSSIDSSSSTSPCFSANMIIQSSLSDSTPNKNSPLSQMSSSEPCSFRSWLRGNDTLIISSNTSLTNTSTSLQATSLKATELSIACSELSAPCPRSPLTSNRRETGSFNIASLMKSKEADRTHQSHTVPDPNKQLHATSASDISDYNMSTPKDTFHQTLETEIFDCLQFVDSSVRPLAAGTSSTSTLDLACMSESTHSSRNNVGINSMQRKSTLTSFDFDFASTDFSRPTVPSFDPSLSHFDPASESRFLPTAHQLDIYSDESSQTHNSRDTNNNRERLAGPVRHSYSSRCGVSTNVMNRSIVTSTVTTSLWQPAVMNSDVSRPVISNLPQIQGCFSPISYSYLNSSNHQLSHRATTISQTLNNNLPWLSPSIQSEDFSFGLSTMMTVSSGPETFKSKDEVSKKRKISRLSHKTSKRKKSNSLRHQEDLHSISRLIAHQPSVSLPPSQSFVKNPTGSYCNEIMPNPNSSSLYHPPVCNAIMPSHLGGYNSYTPQSNLFHSPSVTPQAPYPSPHPRYFPYNSSVPPPPRRAVYVPRYPNFNHNNNNASMNKKKESQHHISTILS